MLLIYDIVAGYKFARGIYISTRAFKIQPPVVYDKIKRLYLQHKSYLLDDLRRKL